MLVNNSIVFTFHKYRKSLWAGLHRIVLTNKLETQRSNRMRGLDAGVNGILHGKDSTYSMQNHLVDAV